MTAMRWFTIAILASIPACWAQLGMFSREQRVALTRDWKGERFEDGRPKIPDTILQRMKNVSAEEAWAVVNAAGFRDQFERGWQRFNVTDDRLVGRAVTAVFMPVRPDVNAVINERGKAEGRVSTGQNSWVIDTLQPGDVLVVDLYEKYNFMGDNLAMAVFAKTNNGIVINGGARDLTGISRIEGFTGYVRGFHPSSVTHGVRNTMLMGINVPIRIGDTTVMLGDVVLGDPEGVMFIPPQLAERVADHAEATQLRDEWSRLMIREGRYTPGQIDTKWSAEMEQEFRRWAAERKAR
jgi:regulator of RNase E activity RraA